MNYYNDHCPSSAAWLRQLIADGLIPAGWVDERSITEIKAHELSEYIQCHFFAGIGGWPLALAIAGWPASRPVWTGSCPCQPYSIAGKGKGDDDERNLWPAFFNLIKECRPEFVFGEQVADAIGKGWLDGIQSNMEGEDYTVGSVVLGAHSVGAPQIRRRLYWVADSENANGWSEQQQESAWRGWSRLAGSGFPFRLANSTSGARAQHVGEPGGEPRGQAGPHNSAECRGDHGGLGIPNGDGWESGESAGASTRHGNSAESASFWSDAYWLLCRDGKHRRVPTQPALFPLADGIPYKLARRGSIRPALLKGAGNAIVPDVAADFIRAFAMSKLNATAMPPKSASASCSES